MQVTEENKNSRMMGITDIPCSEEEQDLLDIKKYVDGLEKFIRNCPTPMSIAIQGDWGTGKTSTINMLQKRLENNDAIKCVYFNTWQYSQFSMSDDLYLSFVNALMRKCNAKRETAKEIFGIVQKIGTKAIVNTVKDATGIDTEEFFKRQEEKMDNVEKLREKFAKLIMEETEDSPNGRMVVFIDDLDRLNPEVAVELLEVIKLFMDVKNCIFVLAIDYDVVVSGVRSKYGQNVSEEKCRSFFDKIIQLPFRLPVESYRLDSIIRETVADDIVDEDIDPLSDFISEMLSSNPRAYKRLANSFYLIKSVNETVNSNNGNEEKQIDNVLIFGSLCIQMCIPKLYQIIVSVSDEKKLKEVQSIETGEGLDEYLKKYNLDIKMDDEEKQDILRSMISFCSLLNSVQQNHKKLKDMHAHLSGILQMTAITSVVNNGDTQKRAAAKKVNKVVVNGVEKNVGTPTDAIVHTYTTLLDGDMELIEEFRVREERILTYDESRTESFYRNKKVLVEKDGVKVFIGLSSSTNDKMKYVTKLCDFIAEKGKPAHVIWKDNEQVMYMHE